MTQTVKNLPAIQKTWVQSLGWEDPLEKGMDYPPQYSCLKNSTDRVAWWATVHEATESWTPLSQQHSYNDTKFQQPTKHFAFLSNILNCLVLFMSKLRRHRHRKVLNSLLLFLFNFVSSIYSPTHSLRVGTVVIIFSICYSFVLNLFKNVLYCLIFPK